jgi:hypothetical protein
MKFFVYLTVREPGPRSQGEPVRRCIEVLPYKAFIQELSGIGDTIFRKPLGEIEARSWDEAERLAEASFAHLLFS